jgi:O-antigen ligase
MNQKIEYVNFSKLLPNNFFIFILGFISGSQIQIFDGLYLAHFVFVFLFLFNVKLNKFDLNGHLIFISICLFSFLYNYLLYDSSNFKISNFLNTIFLYSAILISLSYKDFTDLFKGYFLVFLFQLIFVVINFNFSLLNNGFFLFFTNEREWMEGYNFFGNSFAILGLILNYINYKIYTRNLLVFFIISFVLILTTSRLSLFGIIFGMIVLFKNYFWKYKLTKLFLFLLLPLLVYNLFMFNYSDLDGFEIFTNRLTYSDDRSYLAEITRMLFFRHPLIGNGPILIEKYTLWEPHLHNIWFDIIVGYGLFAFFIFLILIIKKVRSFLQSSDDYLFIFFIFLCSISQISLKEPVIGLIFFSYLNLFANKNFKFTYSNKYITN